MKTFVKEYFVEYNRLTRYNDKIYEQLFALKTLFEKTHRSRKKIIFLGNGGSAAMASHCAVDLTKNAGIRSINFNEADLITCFGNDFGYENWMKEALRFYADEEDTVVLISSSGRSKNVIKAAEYCLNNNLKLVTVTGMDTDNPLKSLNKDGINLWVESKRYNLIEMTHHFWLLCVVDMIIGKAEYPV